MSGLMTPERARELLEARLDELGALRNAHARDPNFKQWRQATLTVIQRIWPGDVLRAERFRRVPFSPPSNKMSLKATRSFFEKGCAEATSLVRNMIRELGGSAGRPQRVEDAAAHAPGEVEDDFPVVDLPGKSGSPRRAKSDDDDDDGLAIPPAPTPAPEREPRTKPDAGRVSMKSTSQSNDGRPPLREMLGFSSRPMDDEEGADEIEMPADLAADLERTPIFEGFEAKAEENEWEVDESDADADFVSLESGGEWDAPEEFQLPARVQKPRIDVEVDPIIETDPENFPPAEPEAPQAEDEPDTGAEMEEFLRTSPVLKASARPVKKRDSNVPATPSPAAASLVALASEVAHLGVPEGQRAGMRATLIELARRVDERSVDWDSLRDSFHAVLDFPPLARRVIPLLIPYLDAAA
jgi:hypothetical protein